MTYPGLKTVSQSGKASAFLGQFCDFGTRPSSTMLLKWALGALLGAWFVFTPAAQAQVGDGARAYFPPPVDSNILTFYQVDLDGNSPGNNDIVTPNLDASTDLSILQYSRSFGIGNKYASISAVAPYASISSAIDTTLGSRRFSQSGWGDASLVATIGLVNLTPLTMEEWLATDPGFFAGAIAQWTMPTGEYDASQALNTGANRHSLRLGGIFYYVFGETLHDSDLGTIEFIPSVTFFTDNNAAFGGGTKSQDPLIRLEGHFTKNFSKHFWASLDFLGRYGGETETRGVKDDNSQNSLGLGATVAGVYKGFLTAKLSYGEIVERRDGGLDGDLLRLNLTVVF